MKRTIFTALLLAFFAALIEVGLRWQLSPETIRAPQLTLGVFANVAMLGSMAVLLATAGWGIANVITRLAPTTRARVREDRPAVLIGLVVAMLVVMTDGLAVGRSFAGTGVLFIVALVAGVAAGLRTRHRHRLAKPAVSAMLTVMTVVAWLFCVLATAGAVRKTSERIQSWTANSTAPRVTGADRPPDVVLVVIDTLRADFVGIHDPQHRDLTPNFDRLAESSFVYTHAISTAPWTLPSHASLFTGLYPDVHGVNWGHYKLNEDRPVLAEQMQAQGYRTVGVSNNWLLSKDNGFARGFDTFIETPNDPHLTSWRLALQCGIWRSITRTVGLSPDAADDAGSAWTNWLVHRWLAPGESARRPMFLFINYFEPHDPYRPPTRYLDKHVPPEMRAAYRRLDQREHQLAVHACGSSKVFTASQVELMKRLYAAEVEYQDQRLGELLDILRASDRFDNSWIIVTSDHGELFGEWGMVWHTASSHFRLLHVPMIVRPPGGADGRHLDMPVQPVDLYVTLVEAVGAARSDAATRAFPLPRNSDDPFARRVAVAQSHGASIAGLSITQRADLQADLTRWLTWVDSIYMNGHLLEVDSAGGQALFDVAADPAMANNLADVQSDRTEIMVDALDEWRGIRSSRTAWRNDPKGTRGK